MRLRNYNKEFKFNVISLCSDGKTISKVSKDFGIPASTLNGWVKQHKKEKDKSFPDQAILSLRTLNYMI